MRVLYVAPMVREARATGAEACGAGAHAGEYVDQQLRDGAYDAVVIAGVCGGLDPSLTPGAVIIARRALDVNGRGIDVDTRVLDAVRAALRARRAPFVSASLLSVDAPLAGKVARTDAWNTHGAAGVDMETYGVAAAAMRHGVAWMAVRVVLDPAGSSLPASLAGWRGEAGEKEIMRTALRRPLEWPAYVRLMLQMRAATKALGRSAPAVRDAVASLDAAVGASRTVEAIALV